MKKSRLIFASSTPLKRKQRKIQIALAISGVCALLIGATMGTKYGNWLEQWISWLPFPGQSSSKSIIKPDSTVVMSLASLPASQRSSQLEAIAKSSKDIDRSRARYLLAVDLIQQKQGEKALSWLEGLESDYKVLAPYVALKRAQAYEGIGNKAKAKETWQEVLQRYPQQPVMPEALSALGKINPKDWENAITLFPGHPRTLEFVRRQLQQNPNQARYMLLLVKYAPQTPEISTVLDRLVAQNATGLKPKDWEAIAQVYWNKQDYSKGGSAYAGATQTARNAYRFARGLELSSKKEDAIAAYQYLIKEFPTAPEAGTSLLRLANLSQTPEALAYLEQVINKFPNQAGEALLEKAKILDDTHNPQGAEQARQILFNKYGSSEAAAEYRWNDAQKLAAAGNFQGAYEQSQRIVTQSPTSKFAPRSGFWSGKWASKLGRQGEAKTAFEHTLAQYPQSYYAWRSAVFLGWKVGDFTTVRQLDPQVVRPAERSLPPAGSEILKELYQLGQDRDAWTVWQAEFRNRIEPTVAEQFTDGLIQLKIGKYQAGIAQVSKLEDRESPEEQTQYQALRQQMAYWHALYPFPYMDLIETWSEKRQINPLLVTALIRQESRFEPKVHSIVGATGLMQLIPSTATAEAKANNLSQFNLENPKDNIQLGTSYLDTTHRHYNNNSMLAVASYNAGPGNVSKWVKEKGSIDVDEFVESIPFEETKGYVKNVFGNYWNYLRLYNPEISQQVAKYSSTQPTAFRLDTPQSSQVAVKNIALLPGFGTTRPEKLPHILTPREPFHKRVSLVNGFALSIGDRAWQWTHPHSLRTLASTPHQG